MKIALSFLSLFIVAGCSSVNTSSSGDTFVKNNQNQLEVGSSSNKIGTVEFKLLADNAITQSTVKINFNELPFKAKFDLCPQTGLYNDLTSVKTNKSGDTQPVYESKKVSCDSEALISKDSKGNFIISYDLNFLDGFNIASVKGIDKLLPQTIRRLSTSFVGSEDVDTRGSEVKINLEV